MNENQNKKADTSRIYTTAMASLVTEGYFSMNWPRFGSYIPLEITREFLNAGVLLLVRWWEIINLKSA